MTRRTAATSSSSLEVLLETPETLGFNGDTPEENLGKHRFF